MCACLLTVCAPACLSWYFKYFQGVQLFGVPRQVLEVGRPREQVSNSKAKRGSLASVTPMPLQPTTPPARIGSRAGRAGESFGLLLERGYSGAHDCAADSIADQIW